MLKNINHFIVLALFLSINIYGKNIYFISFKDKGDIASLLESPETYLSQKALDRRTTQGISVEESDVPVLETYVNALKDEGVDVRYSSKWENGVIGELESSDENRISSLEFVTDLKLIKKRWNYSYISKFQNEKFSRDSDNLRLDYGDAKDQVTMLNADKMNEDGYTGDGKIIAVFDVGFRNVNSLSQFEHLFTNSQVLSTWNFPDDNEDVYVDSDHGTGVLSVMAAKDNSNPFGIAPDADYMFAITEDSEGEFIVEEYYWLIAAEKADSAGVDIINSSLVYQGFANPTDEYNGKEGLDGNTSVITNAADKAASKGILVVCSAGNYGNSTWKTFGFPADADSVLTVGAVDANEIVAGMSSKGPTADGRIKPDIVAMGSGVSVVSYDGLIKKSSGTSLSSPLMAAFAACLWQSMPNLTNMEIINSIKNSASNKDNPDNNIGYGIPRYTSQMVASVEDVTNCKEKTKMNLVSKVLHLNQNAKKIEVCSLNGRVVASVCNSSQIRLDNFSPGIYLLKAFVKNMEFSEKLYLK